MKMRNLGLWALLTAVIAVSACQLESPVDNAGMNMVTVNLGAEVAEPSTKACLVPDDAETAFAASWESGDDMSLSYYALDYDAKEYEGTVRAIWNGTSFVGSLPDVTGLWEYRACYPYSADGTVNFGSYRTQTGSEYNSNYDLMVSSMVETSDAIAGRNDDGSSIVMPMQRQTAIVRFHFTSSHDTPVSYATLSVNGGDICAENVTLTPSGLSADEYGSSIELTVDDQTADDFVLWFNVLPCSFESMTITVVSGKNSFRFKRGEGEFSEGVLYNVNANVPETKWEEEHAFVPDSYSQVTSARSDWSGTYLAAYVKNGKAMVYTGVDDVNNYVETSVQDGCIAKFGAMAELEVEACGTGYSVKVIGGSNDGKYLSGGTSNGTNFTSTPESGTFNFNSDGTISFSTNSSTSFQFNALAEQLRFRFFKTEQKGVTYFIKNGSTDVEDSVAEVTTLDATSVAQAQAVLNASYNASETPTELGFIWGTDKSDLDQELYAGSGSGKTGSFSKTLVSLSASTTYWYRSYVVVGGKYFYGDIRSFTTSGDIGGEEGSDSAYSMSWLGGYEVPATNVKVSESDKMYEGRYCHSTVSELYGGTYACIYNTDNSSQRIVTHTFKYDGKVLPTYTMLYDQNKHCALWEAMVMGGDDFKDNGVGRNDGWNYDPAIPNSWQPQLSSAYSGYTRGHAIASNYRQTTVAQNKQTFYYSNMTPQSATLNNGNWNNFEQQVKGVSTQVHGTSRLYVVTGPIFDSGYTTASDRNGMACPVPTRYFKCIMECDFNASGEMVSANGAGYMFNHTGDISRKNMTIDQIEAITGFDFFANIPDALENLAESTNYYFF